jgi:hypothetical protein
MSTGKILRAEKRLALMASDLKEETELRERLAAILGRTADALKGPPAELSRHSWHDLPEVAHALRQQLDLQTRAAKSWSDSAQASYAREAASQAKLAASEQARAEAVRNEAVCHCGSLVSDHHAGDGHSPVPMQEMCPYAEALKSISMGRPFLTPDAAINEMMACAARALAAPASEQPERREGTIL